MAKEKEEARKNLAVNKKALFSYEVIERLECGIELKGTEVKAIKSGNFSFVDAYARVEYNQLFLIGLHITPYSFGNIFNHDPLRPRRLLAHRQEIKRLARKTDEKGLTLIPLSFYLKHGLIKVELGICRGKKNFDKRQAIKQRDLKRDVEREFRGRY